MATTKQRINISVSKQTAKALHYLAKRDQKPVATKVTDLVEQALELEEDRFLSAVADERLKNYRGPWLSDGEVWGVSEMTGINAHSKSFDFLANEPELYSRSDIKKKHA